MKDENSQKQKQAQLELFLGSNPRAMCESGRAPLPLGLPFLATESTQKGMIPLYIGASQKVESSVDQ